MNPRAVFDAVNAEFDESVALLVVAINAVHLSMKIKPSDLGTKGRFADRLRKKARKLLWETNDADFELAYAIDTLLYDYECCQTLGTPNGSLGGCVKKSLRDLLHAAQAEIPEELL